MVTNCSMEIHPIKPNKILRQVTSFMLTVLFLASCGNPNPIIIVVTATRENIPPTDSATTTQIIQSDISDGMILFVTNENYHYNLYAIVAGKVTLAAQDILRKNLLSPDGKSIASYDDYESNLQIITPNPQNGSSKTETYKIPKIPNDNYDSSYLNVIWSPDSTKLVIQTQCELYLLTIENGRFDRIIGDCHDVHQIAKGPAHIAWSPDGMYIAFDVLNNDESLLPIFSSQLHGGRPAKIIVANVDELTTTVLDTYGSIPEWSPDSNKILFRGGCRGGSSHVICNETLFVMNSDGSNKVQLSATMGKMEDSFGSTYFCSAGWNFDGTLVYFNKNQCRVAGPLYVIRPDGSGLLTLTPGNSVDAVVSSRSNTIAWFQDSRSIYTSNLDGSNLVKLTDKGYSSLSFSSCGDFVAWKQSIYNWYISNSDGSGKVKFPSRPLFSPDCTQLVFVRNENYIYN